MKKTAYLLLVLITAAACGPSDTQRAQQLVDTAREMVMNDRLNQAKIELDSVHTLYPREVAIRRQAKVLADSIDYIESQRTLVYSDSLLQTLLPQVDPLLKQFRYEKNDKYENAGRYVHKLLNTDSNTARCFLQAYVTDSRITTLKSYYYGSGVLQQTAIELSADSMMLRMEGQAHHFEAEGFHSILTMEEDKALQMLSFISAYSNSRIRINLLGTTKADKNTNYVYYLADNEKVALCQTYQLGFLMNDIRQLEENIRIANAHIQRYENRQATSGISEE